MINELINWAKEWDDDEVERYFLDGCPINKSGIEKAQRYIENIRNMIRDMEGQVNSFSNCDHDKLKTETSL
jgi:hypothetical protein